MTAAAISFEWDIMEGIFDANKRAIYEVDDVVTGFPVFLLAAMGPQSDLESVYRLCRENPPALMQTFYHPRKESGDDIDVRRGKRTRFI